VLCAIVHVTIDLLAIDCAVSVYLSGEEHSDVFVCGPVNGNTKVVTIEILKLGLDISVGEPVVAEPVKVRELLVGHLVDDPIRTGTKAQPNEVIEVKGWQRWG